MTLPSLTFQEANAACRPCRLAPQLIGSTSAWSSRYFSWRATATNRPLIAALVAAVVAGCGSPSRQDTGGAAYSAGPASYEDRLEDGRADAAADLQGTTYTEVADGTACTDDCGGHEAGYEWAKENEVIDPNDCDGNSDSFIEGCQAYGEEIERRAEEAAESADDSAARARY